MGAAENMKRLEKAIFASDARLRIRLDQTGRAKMIMGFGFALPFSVYIIYHLMAPHGVMQNFRSSNGAYMNWA